MHLSFEGDVQLLRRLAQRSLVGMGMGDMEVVDVNGGVTVVGHRPRCNYSIGTLVNKCEQSNDRGGRGCNKSVSG